MTRFACAICGRPINPNDPFTWRGAVVWERPAPIKTSRRSGSDTRRRRRLDEWAHTGCIDDEKAGINPGQEALV